MKIGLAWDFVSARALATGIVVNPRCPAYLRDDGRCGRLATIRVTDAGGRRSTYWCAVHMWPRTDLDFESERWEDYYTDWDRYWRLFPNAMDREFVDWLGARVEVAA